MKFKFIKLLLLVFVLTLMACGFTACGDSSHTHDYTTMFDDVNHWSQCSCGDIVYKEAHAGGKATCAKKAVCKICNFAYGETLSHNYQSVVTDPTCESEGYTTYTCSCGDSYVDNKVDALGHDYKKIVVTEPTCTEMGYTTYSDCVCGHSYVDNYVDAYYHDYGDWTLSPEGAIYKVCARDNSHKFFKKPEDEGVDVLYSARDRALDFPSLKKALNEQEVDIYSLNDIEGYVVNGERVDILDLNVIISNTASGFVDNYGRDRAVAIPQTVTVIVRGKEYVLNYVYAYTKIIDEPEDLKFFTMNNSRNRNEIDGYYIVTKNIDASELVLEEHDFENRKADYTSQIYPGNGYSKDVGFKGVFDGQGYTINGLTVKSCGLFGQANAPVIKNIAFTNVTLTGYYPTLFAMSFTRGKNPNNTFNGYEGSISNVYVSIKSTAKGGASRVGLLVNNVLPSATKMNNVIVEYLNIDREIQSFIDGGKNFYTFGSSSFSMAGSVDTYNNCYSISTAPVLASNKMLGFAENQVEFTLAKAEYGYKVNQVTRALDDQVNEILRKFGKDLSVDHVIVGLRAYDTYEEMAKDAIVNADSLSTFDSKYWVVDNGVPTWIKSL